MPAEQLPDQAVLRKSRQACWVARDSFFECLDKNDNAEKKCRKLRKPFEKACPPAWVRSRLICLNRLLCA